VRFESGRGCSGGRHVARRPTDPSSPPSPDEPTHSERATFLLAHNDLVLAVVLEEEERLVRGVADMYASKVVDGDALRRAARRRELRESAAVRVLNDLDAPIDGTRDKEALLAVKGGRRQHRRRARRGGSDELGRHLMIGVEARAVIISAQASAFHSIDTHRRMLRGVIASLKNVDAQGKRSCAWNHEARFLLQRR
jgi:hypothetical protein